MLKVFDYVRAHLGSCHAWLQSGGKPKDATCIIQQCDAGLIRLRRDGDLLLFRAPPLLRSGPLEKGELDIIIKGLGIGASDVVASGWCDNGVPWRGILLESAEKVLQLAPKAALLGDIDVGVIGPMPPEESSNSLGKGRSDFNYEVRAFCPQDSPFEDPVTGSLNAALAHWLLLAEGIAPSEGYTVRQGTAIGRQGVINIVRYSGDADHVWVGGHCATCIEGTMLLN